jgi:hypothetical protein
MRTIKIDDVQFTKFVIADVEPAYHEAVRSLYYTALPEGFAKVFPNDTQDLDRIYLNFERYARDMVLQTARVLPFPWDKSLSAFLQIVESFDLDWFLTGSAALAVRGLDVLPRDLDIVVDDAGAVLLAELLADYLIEPLQPSQGWIWNYFGRAFLYGRLEWVGGVNDSADNPQPGDFGPVAYNRLESINWRGIVVRVPPLDLQLEVSKRRGLTDRVRLISQQLPDGGEDHLPKN